jgi:hypothetical protein
LKMSEKTPKEMQSMYRVSKDRLRSEARTTKKVKLKDGTKAHEVPVIKNWGAGKNPGIMLAPYKEELKNVDKVVIQLESKNPFKANITDTRAVERGRGKYKVRE